ncbi:MAG TPA: protein kinase [Gemmatimonadales bacterium]|jgi:serine/threonine-protein kinase|nr:protein kinase [Gemmatimonadales bacterium]
MADLRDRLQQTLGGAYTLERELSGGGMSRVFVATETRLGRRVVVKVLRTEITAGPSAERFEREMALCARCHHPHIVPVLATGEIEGLPWFTMPLVEGESLRDRLNREGPLPVGETIRLLAEIADALAYAHRMGVVHRDIKPENILLQDGHAVVADFGVAKALHAATQADSALQVTGVGVMIGTPAYMAPEQATGEAVIDHRVDLYALGVVGYELLTGKNPFGGTSPVQVVTAHLTRTPPSVAEERRDCPPALASLIQRLLAKAAASRPASADEVRAELQAIGSGTFEALARRRPRRFALVAALGAVALLVLLLMLVLTRDRAGRGAAPESGQAVKSLAVLPFQNIGGDSTTDYFSAGITEELISGLGRLDGLRVASRTSAFAARARSADLREIGNRLGVATILEGTVQQSGQRVKVTARLVDVSRDAQLWAGEYRSELRDVFAVQDTIARAIAAALKVTLAAGAGTALVERGTRDSAAHDFYLRGRYFLAFRTPAALRKGREAFEAAIRRDSGFAPAWAGLADAYNLGVPFAALPPSQALPRAKVAALRALALDSTLAEVHTSLGFIAMFIERNWAEAERRFNRAVELNPSYVQGRLFRAWLYMLTGRDGEALSEIERARTLDPLSLIIRTRIGTLLHYMGRDQEAIAAFRSALEIDSTFANARAGLALSYATAGRFQEALSFQPDPEPMLGNYEAGEWGAALALAGRTAEARRVMAELEEQRKRRYVSADAFALIYAALNQPDPAFAEFDRTFVEGSWSPTIAMVEPTYRNLYRDPRWARLMARVNALPAILRRFR